MQEVAYDALGEHIARRTVPIREDAREADILANTYQFDALDREIVHTPPWRARTMMRSGRSWPWCRIAVTRYLADQHAFG
jgi:hypothetical protein